MNSYRMGHLTKDGGVLEGRHFPVLFDTEEEFGEEDGTIRNLTIRYLDEVKKGDHNGRLYFFKLCISSKNCSTAGRLLDFE